MFLTQTIWKKTGSNDNGQVQQHKAEALEAPKTCEKKLKSIHFVTLRKSDVPVLDDTKHTIV